MPAPGDRRCETAAIGAVLELVHEHAEMIQAGERQAGITSRAGGVVVAALSTYAFSSAPEPPVAVSGLTRYIVVWK